MISQLSIYILEFLSSYTLVVITLFTLFILKKAISVPHKNLPPGPKGFPIVGYFPFLSKETFKDFQKLAKKYGPVFGLTLGNKYVLIVNNFTVAKEVLSNSAYLGKPPHSVFHLLPDGVGVSSVNGESWFEQRKFIAQVLKTLGVGSRDLEDHIHEEISNLLQIIEGHKGKPISVVSDMTTSLSNVIWGLLFGSLLKSDDHRKKQLEEGVKTVSDVFEQSSIIAFVPFLKDILNHFKFGYYYKALESLKRFNRLMREQVDIRREKFGSKESEDFIERYMYEMETRQNTNKNTSFNETNLIGNLQGFFIAGTETTRTTLLWAFLISAAYPDIQKRIYNEITEAIGKERQINWTDHSLLPFTESFMMEVQRWKTVAPVGGLRYTFEDTSAGGYFVPKNTTLLVNLWAIHHDPAHWNNPDEFNPERFLNKEKNGVVRFPYFVPFSIGKRNCPGEVMANIEAFLYFTSILQKFEIKMPEGEKADLESTDFGLTLRPLTQNLCYVIRN